MLLFKMLYVKILSFTFAELFYFKNLNDDIQSIIHSKETSGVIPLWGSKDSNLILSMTEFPIVKRVRIPVKFDHKGIFGIFGVFSKLLEVNVILIIYSKRVSIEQFRKLQRKRDI